MKQKGVEDRSYKLDGLPVVKTSAIPEVRLSTVARLNAESLEITQRTETSGRVPSSRFRVLRTSNFELPTSNFLLRTSCKVLQT